MNSLHNLKHEKLDEEWIVLIQTAKMMGLSIEDVRLYLANFAALNQPAKQNSAYEESAVSELATTQI